MVPIPFVWVLIRFFRALWQSLKDPEFQALFFLVVTMLASGALFYRRVEGWTLLNSLYFSVITLTTVGYEDFSPSTTVGKIFTMFYIFVGIGTILGFVNAWRSARWSSEAEYAGCSSAAAKEKVRSEKKAEELCG